MPLSVRGRASSVWQAYCINSINSIPKSKKKGEFRGQGPRDLSFVYELEAAGEEKGSEEDEESDSEAELGSTLGTDEGSDDDDDSDHQEADLIWRKRCGWRYLKR